LQYASTVLAQALPRSSGEQTLYNDMGYAPTDETKRQYNTAAVSFMGAVINSDIVYGNSDTAPRASARRGQGNEKSLALSGAFSRAYLVFVRIIEMIAFHVGFNRL
jgi:hypothetical protein